MTTYTFAHRILARISGVVLRPQPTADWNGAFPLPNAVAEYFHELGPVNVQLETYGNSYYLPQLSELWSHQVGYRSDGFTGERLPEWSDDWLVVADQGGDPFIFSLTTERILHAYHGEGVWEPTQVFENMAEMVSSFAVVGEIAALAGPNLTDEESLLRPQYRDEARARIMEFAGSSRVDSIVSVLGWTAH